MGVEVDSVIVDLEARIGKYRTDMREAIDLQRQYQGGWSTAPANNNGPDKDAQAIVNAAEKATQGVGQARKKRTDAARQADAQDIASSKKATDAQIADADRLDRRQDQLARNAVTREAQRKARNAGQPPSAARSAINIATSDGRPDLTDAEYQAALARTAAARAAVAGPGPVARPQTTPVAEQKQVNNLALDLFDITQKQKAAEGDTAIELGKQVEYLRLISTYKAKGLSDEQATIRAEITLIELEKIRAETAEKQAVVQGGAGKNAARFAEGAGLGRSFGSGATVAGIATAGAIAGVYELAKAGLEYSQSLKQDSDQLGLTTRDLQIYQTAAHQAGLSTEQFKEGIGQLSDNLGKAQEGSKAQSLIFQRLHVDVGNAQTGYKSLSDVLPTLSDRLSQITDKTQRQAIEQALGGEQLRKMDPILSQGAASFDAYGRSIEKAGGILADSDIQKSAETANKIKLLNDQLQRDLASTVAHNADAILGLARAFLSLADGALKAFTTLQNFGAMEILNHPKVVGAVDALSGNDPAQDRNKAFGQLLTNAPGRQMLLSQNSDALNALNLADKGGIGAAGSVDLPGYGSITNDPKQRYALHQQVLAARSRIVAANRADQFNTPAVQPGAPDGNVLAGPDKKGRKGKSPEDLAEAEIARQKQFSDQLASLQEEALRAQESMTGSIQEQAKDEDQLAAAQYAKKIGDINSNLAKQLQQIAKDYPKGGGETFAAEAVENAKTLRALATIADNVGKQARDQQTAAETARALNAHSETQLSINADLLNDQLSLARTTKDRLDIELKLLDNAKERERNDLNTQLQTLKPGDPARDDVQKRLDSLDQRYDGQAAGARERNLTPGQSYVRSLETTPDTIQQKEVDVLGQFNAGLDKSIEKTLHLHGILGQIVGDLVDMVVKQALIKPLASALFGADPGATSAGGLGGLLGGSGGGIGGLLGKLGGLFGLGGAGASSGIGSLIGGAAPSAISGFSIDPALLALPGLAGGGSIGVGGNAGTDRNVMSINGQPVARINQGETINVVPTNQRVNSAAGSNVMPLHQTINIDNRSSLTPADFASQIISVSADHANRVAAQSGRSAVQAAPAQVRQTQVLKG